MYQTKYWTILVQDCQSSSPFVRWKLNTSLTQKDTMDRGAWIKCRKKSCRRTQKGQKGPKSTKVQNGTGMRNKRIFLFTICYNPVVSKLGVLPPKLYLVVFYQVSLVNWTRITCSNFREPSVLLLGSFVVLYHMFIPHGGIVINVLAW